MKNLINKILNSAYFWGIIISAIFLGGIFLEQESMRWISIVVGTICLVLYIVFITLFIMKKIK